MGNYFKAIAEQDYPLHFPYQSYDYVLVFFNLAMLDQDVTEIMATFYRVAQDSYIVNALISAAKNGKKVKAFVELKARFDEANNIHWANKMAEAGVEITYSIPGIKVHAKAALIKRREKGKLKQYAFSGTGNFNEKLPAYILIWVYLHQMPHYATKWNQYFNIYTNEQYLTLLHIYWLASSGAWRGSPV